MKSTPREALNDILQVYGKSVISDSRKLKGLLNDSCGEYKIEIRALLSAVEEKIPEELLNFTTRNNLEIIRPRLIKRLTENRTFTGEAAEWALDSWVYALGLTTSVKTPNLLPRAINTISTWIPTPGQEYDIWLRTNQDRINRKGSAYQPIQCKAGFLTEIVKTLVPRIQPRPSFSISELTNLLCSFTLIWTNAVEKDMVPQPSCERICAIFSNLISRGFPTLCSTLVEDIIAQSISSVINLQKTTSEGIIQYRISKGQKIFDEFINSILHAFVIVEPRGTKSTCFPVSTDPEKVYLFDQLLPSLLLPPLDQYVRCDLIDEETGRIVFDCAFELEGIKKGIKIVDSLENEQGYILPKKYQNWQITRISKEKIRDGSISTDILKIQEGIERNPIFKAAQENLNTPLWFSLIGRKALELVLSPFAVARIQKVLLLALQNSKLSLDNSVWNLTVIERDVPCAVLAITDFVDHLQAFYQLLGIKRSLPEINIQVLHTAEFIDGNEQLISGLDGRKISYSRTRLHNLEQINPLCEMIIDISMLLRRDDIDEITQSFSQNIESNPCICSIRSNLTEEGKRQLFPIEPLSYSISDYSDESLLFFLRNIFRKLEFRPGQLDIIKRAMGLKPVIGLLPTGAGKSISYQLPALLQPGVTLVVDPLRSLMVDQVANLKEQYLIDSVGVISSQFNADDRERVLSLLRSGQLQFIFVAPERLQNKIFRDNLVELTSAFAIPYAVIDEAHCVSEWGHDFRTSYLNLAKTIQAHCIHHGKKPSIIALTGTASYSVLIDIQREMEIIDDESMVLPPTFDREELEFGIYSVPTSQKWQKLAGLLRSLPQKFHILPEQFFTPNQENTTAGLVFVPHVNGPFGVLDIANKINREFCIPVKIYSGTRPRDWRGTTDFEVEKEQAQREFKNNEIPILVATKAFGMGIDKPNIRYTIHYNIPHSLEAFYQEVGRAGRDQKKSFCALIFSDDQSHEVNKALDPSAPIDEIQNIPQTNFLEEGDIKRLFFFHKQAFRGEEEEYKWIVKTFKPIYKILEQTEMGNEIHYKLPFGNNAGNDREDTEKALYRLSIIGAIDDYTVNFSEKYFDITARLYSDQEYISKLEEYVARYKSPHEVAEVHQKILNQPSNGIISKCSLFLLSFIYQEVEKKRRAAIRTMVEVSRQASVHSDPNTFLRREIIAYMKQTPINDLLIKLVRRMISKEWWEILNLRDNQNCLLIESEEGARQILGSCRRTLESYPDHPGLLFLSGLSRLFLNDQDAQESNNDFRAGLLILEQKNEPKKEEIAIELLDIIENNCGQVKYFNDVRIKTAKEIMHLFPTRRVARRVLHLVPSEAASIIVSRLSNQLHTLNNQLSGEE